MTIFEIADAVLLRPLQYLFELIYINANNVIGSPGLSIIALSLVMNILLLPLYKRADALQEEERQTEARLSRGVAQIKKAFKGDERMMILQTYYRQNHYKPTYILRGAVSLMLEIPFFMAAYRFLSNMTLIQGVPFGPIGDLGLPDGLLTLGGMHINVLPILMTGINLVSCVIFTKGAPLKSKLQLYGMAIFFLFFLYDSPSGLVFYWTLNNVFSLGKTVFYKLKNPQKLLRIGASVLGLAMLAGIFAFAGKHRPVVQCVLAAGGILLQLPMILHWLPKKASRKAKAEPTPQPKLFFAAAGFLALFVGAYIPLSVVVSSAQEFVNVRNYQNPLWFIVSSFCLALGSFLVWPGIFYQLAGNRNKRVYEKAMCVLVAAAVADFMFFGNNKGTLSSTLVYETELVWNVKEVLLNTAVVAALTAAVVLVPEKWDRQARKVIGVLSLAVAVMVGMNAVNVNGQVESIRQAAEEDTQTPKYTISKNGKNVIVVMLDRAAGEFVPFIFNEKPELKEQFDGFTAYTNVVSTGAYTNFGTPALLGGYEYTPENLNKRAQESLAEKHNEALKVMPVLFSEHGYEATVFQPPYAGYQWTPDLSIYDNYPEIRRCNIVGEYEPAEVYEDWTASNMRNFFLYGAMKACPVALQRYIYGQGQYNRSNKPAENYYGQEVLDAHRADGLLYSLMENYNVLTNLTRITEIGEDTGNTFLFMANDTTHEVSLMQEPEYVPQTHVDNTQYDLEHADRFTLNGTTLQMDEIRQYEHYESNMAAMIQLGKWFDYLRAEGVYDNTRIILVSDHGRDLAANKSRILPDGVDACFFYPILYVKDFDAKGFSFSDTFMTTADVPTLAVDGLIENPTNPFTGNPICSDAKQGNVYVFYSRQYDVLYNNGNQFEPGDWYRIDNQNMQDLDNWVKVGENTCLPEE